MESIIRVDHLIKHFKGLTAVDDLSFSVQKGDIYGFLGQNGAGKSTTIRMLMSLIQPTHGSIELFGLNFNRHKKEILRQTGAIIEKPDLYSYLTAYENIELFSKLSISGKTSRVRIHEVLDIVGLEERSGSRVKTFSQGMKQRLGIGIALVHDPQLVILDEPTNGLDPQGIADVRNLVLSLSRVHGKTVFVSSHLLSEVEVIANRVLIIDKGKKIVEGAANELFDPANTIVELTTTDAASALLKIENSAWGRSVQESTGSRLILKIDRSHIPSFNAFLVQEQIPVFSLQQRHSLEDYFLKVTTGQQHVEAFAN